MSIRQDIFVFSLFMMGFVLKSLRINLDVGTQSNDMKSQGVYNY